MCEEWVKKLMKNLENVKPKEPKNQRNAGVAIILKPTKNFNKENIQILFIKRTTRKGDRWSGNVAYPGGKQDPGETLKQTTEREIQEEIGIDISNENNFHYLGRFQSFQTRDIHVFPFSNFKHYSYPISLFIKRK
jgi:8-oxo-dGTP pyrophosphatase MutT (NUDIX family)